MKRMFLTALGLFLTLNIMFSISSCNAFASTATMVGEIMHVEYDRAADDAEHLEYHIYVQPFGKNQNAHWEYFTVNIKTKTESEFSVHIDEMPELAVGNIVEIEYYKRLGKSSVRNDRYGVASIKTVDNTYGIAKQENIALKLNKDFSYTKPDGGLWEATGTVLHVVKVDAPLSGYLVYFDGTTPFVSSFQCYWIGDIGLGTSEPEIIEKLESGEVGYTICFEIVSNQHPFENYAAIAILKVELVTE